MLLDVIGMRHATESLTRYLQAVDQMEMTRLDILVVVRIMEDTDR